MPLVELVCDVIPQDAKAEYCINGKDITIHMEECEFNSADEFKDIFNKFTSVLEKRLPKYKKIIVLMVLNPPIIIDNKSIKTKIGFYASTDEKAFEGLERIDDSHCPKIIQDAFNFLAFNLN